MGKTEHFCADGLIKSAGVTTRIQNYYFLQREREIRENKLGVEDKKNSETCEILL